MINKHEILRFAKEYKLPANTIEKDYVLNWVLDGIANSSLFKDRWIFKGEHFIYHPDWLNAHTIKVSANKLT